LCHVGSAALDGDFATFQQRVMAQAPQVNALDVTWQTPQGKHLAFGWEGALRVNDVPENWDDYPHYENAYTQTALDAGQMTIQYGDLSLTLDLQHGREVRA
jgi:hypothetical protein